MPIHVSSLFCLSFKVVFETATTLSAWFAKLLIQLGDEMGTGAAVVSNKFYELIDKFHLHLQRLWLQLYIIGNDRERMAYALTIRKG
jgi:hypothetical protein